ncbi:MAG: DUF4097 family beta strand repeat-containing protein [Marmoricola sp.]
MQHRFSTGHPVHLNVQLGKGSLTVQATETSETVVEVTGAEAEAVAVVQNDQQIVVVAPRHSFGVGKDRGVDVTVTLPLDSDLFTKMGSTDTVARGRLGLARLKSGSGYTSLDETTGGVVVDLGSGELAIETVGGDLRVKSGSGDVRVGSAAGSVGVSTGSGDVRIGTASTSTVLKSGSGDLSVDCAESDLTVSTGSGDLEVGQFSRGRAQARTGSGEVRIGIPAGVPVWTDVRSVSGRIDSDLAGAGQPTEGQDHVELRVTTASGDVVLRQL